jgi:y4mF family transcriptional regulator
MMAEPRRRAREHSGELAETFVARRHQLRMTQAELALLAGVGRSTVQALEGGKNTVQLDSVVAVADALGCDIALLARAGSFVPPLDPT